MLFSRLLLVLLVGTLLTSGVACKKSGASDGGAFTIKGAQEVIAALDREDYAGVVTALPEVKAGLPEDKATKEWEDYRRLLRKVKEVMVGAMGTNQGAAKAYDMLRMMETGR